MKQLCRCVGCHKSGMTEKKHGSSCCFTPNVTFKTKNINVQVRPSYCSAECEMEAFRTLKRDPSLESMLKSYATFDFRYEDLLRNAQTKQMINNKLRAIDSNDYTIDGMLLPNFVAARMDRSFDFFREVIDLGFHYDKNDLRFFNFIYHHVEKKPMYLTTVSEQNKWIQSFLKDNVDLFIKISVKHMEEYSGIAVDIDSFKGFETKKDNNKPKNNNKKQKKEDEDDYDE